MYFPSSGRINPRRQIFSRKSNNVLAVIDYISVAVSQLNILITFRLKLKSRWHRIRKRSEIYIHVFIQFFFTLCRVFSSAVSSRRFRGTFVVGFGTDAKNARFSVQSCLVTDEKLHRPAHVLFNFNEMTSNYGYYASNVTSSWKMKFSLSVPFEIILLVQIDNLKYVTYFCNLECYRRNVSIFHSFVRFYKNF